MQVMETVWQLLQDYGFKSCEKKIKEKNMKSPSHPLTTIHSKLNQIMWFSPIINKNNSL